MTASCYRSLVSSPGYDRFELLLRRQRQRAARDRVLLAELSQDPRVRVLHDPQPFNWVAINNARRGKSEGRRAFVHEQRHRGAFGGLAGGDARTCLARRGRRRRRPAPLPGPHRPACRPSWSDELGGGSRPQGLPFGEPGYMLMAELARNCSAVTGACMMTREPVSKEQGGFDAAAARRLQRRRLLPATARGRIADRLHTPRRADPFRVQEPAGTPTTSPRPRSSGEMARDDAERGPLLQPQPHPLRPLLPLVHRGGE